MARIAQVLSERPEAVFDLSINELASAAETSAATVTRFCQLLGYAGYPALRVSVAADVGRSKASDLWARGASRVFDPDDSSSEIIRDLLAAQLDVLQTAVDLLDVKAMERAAEAILKSRHVDIYGVGGSGHAARDLQLRLYSMGINAHAFTELHFGLTSAALLTGDCVAVALSSSGVTIDTLDMISLARRRGAFTIGMTTDPLSPVAQAVEAHIQTAPSREYFSHRGLAALSGQLFATELLYLLVARGDHDRAEKAVSLADSALAARRVRTAE
jgi:DNA-binding MurR/RpiR family transcriptional regulator